MLAGAGARAGASGGGGMRVSTSAPGGKWGCGRVRLVILPFLGVGGWLGWMGDSIRCQERKWDERNEGRRERGGAERSGL